MCGLREGGEIRRPGITEPIKDGKETHRSKSNSIKCEQ